MEKLNGAYVTRALCFHGQPLQKIWEDERGPGELQQIGVPTQPSYTIYQERQKHFTFQDRAKRLKMHQFLARKANDLYDMELAKCAGVPNDITSENAKSFMATLPPYEMFVNKSQDKIKRWRCVLEGIKQGDIIYGVVTKAIGVSSSQMMVKALCTAEPLVRYLNDIPTKCFLHPANMGPLPVDSNGKTRQYAVNDFVCCEVLEISVDADRLYLGMKGVMENNCKAKLGLVAADDLPLYYRKANDNATEKYHDCLLKAKESLNPNYDVLYEINGLNVNDTFSLMSNLKHQFPREEYAIDLRHAQASKWAFRSVAEGIEHFKRGNHVEAFQCLNKALNIDPKNVEGLVARGALYANKGSFLKAVEDFEKALKLNSFHVNARKYMGETLVALGRSYEEDNRIKEAAKAYMDCLNIIPNHEQARLSLEAINHRDGGHMLYDNLLDLPRRPSQIAASEERKSLKKKRRSSSSSSSSDDSSSEESTSSDSHPSDKFRPKNFDALSPLSKRMALHAASLEAAKKEAFPAAAIQKQQFNQPFYMAREAGSSKYTSNGPPISSVVKSNEFKLDDDDTESRVRKLLQEASKYKKDKKKKNKKKKSKKSKKETKPKDPTDILKKFDFQEAYKAIGGYHIEHKLTENLEKCERTIAEIKRRQEHLGQSNVPPTAPSVRDGNSSRNVIHFGIGPLTRDRRSETPPPKPPSMKITENSNGDDLPAARMSTSGQQPLQQKEHQQKLSFQIRKPAKVDKFGLVRIATPLAQPKSPSPYRGRSRSRDREEPERRRRRRSLTQSRSRSPSRDRRRRRSRSRDRRRSRSSGRRRRSSSSSRRRRSRSGRRSRSSRRSRSDRRSPSSRSRSPRTMRRTTSNSIGGGNSSYIRSSYSGRNSRRRTPSPFVPRGTPPPRRGRRSRTRSRSKSPRQARPTKFGNRVWKRPGYAGGNLNNSGDDMREGSEGSGTGGRWLHDKFEEQNDNVPRDDVGDSGSGGVSGGSVTALATNVSETETEDSSKVKVSTDATKRNDDGPSIEEIDEIINKAQKERKQEIINRDKDILKKPIAGSF